MAKEFELLAWSGAIPLYEDLWLGMQAPNVAMVRQAIIRDIENRMLEGFYKEDKLRLLNRACPCFMPTASAEAGSKG